MTHSYTSHSENCTHWYTIFQILPIHILFEWKRYPIDIFLRWKWYPFIYLEAWKVYPIPAAHLFKPLKWKYGSYHPPPPPCLLVGYLYLTIQRKFTFRKFRDVNKLSTFMTNYRKKNTPWEDPTRPPPPLVKKIIDLSTRRMTVNKAPPPLLKVNIDSPSLKKEYCGPRGIAKLFNYTH